jgi:membrane protease YdiL (CAAX protease family)
MIGLTIDFYFLALVFTLAVVMPLMGVRDFHRLKQWLAAGRTDARLAIYREIMIVQWGLVAVFVGWWLGLGRDLGQARMGFGPAGWEWLAVGMGFLATALVVAQAVAVLRDPAQQAEVRGKVGGLEPLIPRTPAEGNAFGFVSLTAGVSEEILYRGLLLGALSAVIGPWPAVAVSSVIFGLGHAYQGGTGIVKTGLVGLVMALLTVFSGTIWIAALLHTVIDVTSGRMMSAALNLPEPGPESGPEPEPAP